MKQLSAQDFEVLISDKKVKLLDVREQHEFAQGHIKGAQLVPSTNFWEEFESLGIKKSDKIALYCYTGSRSDFIARELEQAGYKNVFNLEMGIVEWLESGKPTVKK
ncbi:MAG: sulfurtransferase [Acidobacteria bacterium]|nr:MAG: sulfurtransferase [Acidobacteriota bacterium]